MSDSLSIQTVTVFNNLYAEALGLARETRDYLLYQESADRLKLNAETRLIASCEAMRMTARITQILAWLMTQRAVHSGELSRQEASKPELRLSGYEICAQSEPDTAMPLPPRLLELLNRSLALYERIMRLDAMLDRDPGELPLPIPSHSD